jgi:hypothetical protein
MSLIKKKRKKNSSAWHPSSFRDPSGFIFYYRSAIYRQINKSYKDDYEYLNNSGLYFKLINKKLLIPHKEVNTLKRHSKNLYKIIKPEKIGFVSYPYEWCFGQLKDAALTTLQIQKTAIKYGATLKDSSAYNIQFHKGNPLLIDTLSFERIDEKAPWIAYRQFCQFFLAPLALASKKDIRLTKLLRTYIDGVPLDLASKLLPAQTWLSPKLLLHIHLHSMGQNIFKNSKITDKKMPMGKRSHFALIENLKNTIINLRYKSKRTRWENYYENIHYNKSAFKYKKTIIKKYLKKIKNCNVVLDMGANTGMFSRLIPKNKALIISADNDEGAVEVNYQKTKTNYEKHIIPLNIDFTNPSPGLGWANKERASFFERCKSDLILALALIHHLFFTNNVYFFQIAKFLSENCKYLMIEFALKDDPKVKTISKNKPSLLPKYNIENFEAEFSTFFKVLNKQNIPNSKRVIYLMQRK